METLTGDGATGCVGFIIGDVAPLIPATTLCCCCCCTDIAIFISIIALELPAIWPSGNPAIIPAAFPVGIPAEFLGIMGMTPGCWPRMYIWEIPPISGCVVKKPRG